MTGLSELEKKVVAAIQGDIPITERPYLEIAEKLGITEAELLDTLKALDGRGIVRRFGATLRHQKSGFSANAMAAWRVDEDRVHEVGRKLAGHRAVSHCYRRDPTPQWPYNLYTMIHARNMDACEAIVRKMAAQTAISDYTILFSRRELKKTSMQYFPDEPDD